MFKDLLHLFLPKKCVACNENIIEHEIICTSCLHQLPLANTHLHNENTLKKVFDNKLPLCNITCLLYFYKKGITQNLFHNLKYRNHPEISTYLGEWICYYLAKNDFMKDIEVVIPVPIHKSRKKERGYNQVEGFAKVIAQKFNIYYIDDVLIKKEATKTQVFKSKLARQEIKSNYFSLENETKIAGKHILLVDDIITTGSTLVSCGKILNRVNNIKLSIASMAYTP
ncbi:ComF family protein [Mesonia aestuariivivens]|uniref:ComF family protein n=1 Tax=Mesonia aestuariivivens TaxID=2796128 RepID=A0ABS6W2H5_9FLAO|nr:phosphoribosyltransferase family protein [Mesonia aestuariivivens]MBW2961924.1 ComF family protein [Mesonia aestuariivivens]